MTKDTDLKTGLFKTCTKCGETKSVEDYHKAKKGKFGRSATCKACKAIWAKQDREKYPEKWDARIKSWQARNPEKMRAIWAEGRKRTREKRAEYQRERYRSDPEKYNQITRDRRASNPEGTRAHNKKSNDRRRKDPKFRLEQTVRRSIYSSISSGSKRGRKTFEILGYSPQDLRDHLEKHFHPGMSWDNYGKFGWHIDHIIPLSAHNYETPDDIDFKRAWALENLRPLWWQDNIKKGAKIDGTFQPSLALAVNDNNETIVQGYGRELRKGIRDGVPF
jgi:hypothetical protein